MRKFDSLKEIAQTDFSQVVIEEHGISPEELEAERAKDAARVEEMIANERRCAVMNHLFFEDNWKNTIAELKILEKQRELVRAHCIGFVMVSKIKRGAAEELSKLNDPCADFLILETLLKDAVCNFSKIKKGSDIYIAVQEEMKKLIRDGPTGLIGVLIDILLEQPDWIERQMANLVMADEYLRQAMPGGIFPSEDQITKGAEMILGDEWTPGHSVRYWLQAAQTNPIAKKG